MYTTIKSPYFDNKFNVSFYDTTQNLSDKFKQNLDQNLNVTVSNVNLPKIQNFADLIDNIKIFSNGIKTQQNINAGLYIEENKNNYTINLLVDLNNTNLIPVFYA